ncbi:MAG: carbamate kinase [Thermoanaerobaculia bacterium]|nr:carbamate kinase [Thermoanaerobaculia bacterium]
MSTERRKVAVVAFGGNALLQPGDRGTQEEQVARARQASRWLADIVAQGWRLVIVHGNGPQVGNILIQAEEASTKIPPQSLDIAVAQTEGSIGFLLQQAMRNRLEFLGIDPQVATLLSEIEVDPQDRAFRIPTKPIGPFFTKYRAEVLTRDFGWTMREDSGRGWRKVVASPKPRRVLNSDAIRALVDVCDVVVTGGGGGIPVVRGRDRQWRGVEAVIDKDYASALIASELDTDLFIIITGIARVAIEFGRPTQRWLEYLSVEDAEHYLEAGEFPPGSMGPKIEAALEHVRRTGSEVLVTDIDHIREALDGKAGTVIGNGSTRYAQVPSG